MKQILLFYYYLTFIDYLTKILYSENTIPIKKIKIDVNLANGLMFGPILIKQIAKYCENFSLFFDIYINNNIYMNNNKQIIQ